MKCQKCGGNLRAIKDGDYKVLEYKVIQQNPNVITLTSSHKVKPESEQFAKDNWC